MVRTVDLVLGAPAFPVSAVLHEPDGVLPRAAIVAVHGAGMNSGYFDAKSEPSLSLCTTATQLGYSVLAIDRPGYGPSAFRHPSGLRMDDQAVAIRAALDDFAVHHHVGAGLFLIAHSYGGAVALAMAAADDALSFIGVDVSGIGHEFASDRTAALKRSGAASWPMNWGKLSLYPPRTFALAQDMIADVPDRELDDILSWPNRFSAIAERVDVPTRFTFAEYEQWWSHDARTLSTLRSHFGHDRLIVDVQPRAGHNISLGWTARAYHLKALAFLEQCLGEQESDLVLRSA